MSNENWLSLLKKQGDPRALHWAQMEAQRMRDAMQGNMPPPDMPENIEQAQLQQDVPLDGGNVVQGAPMAPGQYEQFMRDQARYDLLRRGRTSPLGRKRGLDKASEDLAMMAERQRIDNTPMPAEYSVMGEVPGSTQNFLAKLFTGQIFGTD